MLATVANIISWHLCQRVVLSFSNLPEETHVKSEIPVNLTALISRFECIEMVWWRLKEIMIEVDNFSALSI